MKRILFFLVLSTAILVGCKKKKAAKDIAGAWYEVKIDGQEVPVGAQDQIIFGDCKAKKDDYCDLTIVDAGGTSFDYGYTITDGGETLVLKYDAGFAVASQTNNIEELTDTRLVIKWGGSGGYTGEYSR